MSFSNYLENEVLDHVFKGDAYTSPSGIYVKLHTGDPGEDGTSNAATETTRKEATFGSVASGGTISNTADIDWTDVSTTEEITDVSLWDAATDGNCLGAGSLTASRSLTAGDDFTIETGGLDVSLD